MMTVIVSCKGKAQIMGVCKQQATRNRRAILDAASRVFRERGVDGVGLADLMKEAGFTHGGFYNHFKSKDALAAEACAAAFADGAVGLIAAIEAEANGQPGAWRDLLEKYLSPEHCSAPGSGCPTASLAVDAARQGKEMQSAYAAGLEGFLAVMAAQFEKNASADGQSEGARLRAIGIMANMVGTIVLARAVGPANSGLFQEILAAGREHLPR